MEPGASGTAKPDRQDVTFHPLMNEGTKGVNVLKPHLQTTIWTLLKGGASQREIERITGISRHTIRLYQQRFAADLANCPGAATDPASQTAPPRPPTSLPIAAPVAASRCEPHRAFIDAQLRLGRNATAIYQDLVDGQGFEGAYNSVKRFVAQLQHKEPEQFDRLSFAPGQEMQVDYGEGARALLPVCPAPSGTANPACSWPHCATRGAASGAWSGSPASKSGPSCTSRPGATSVDPPGMWRSTTSRRSTPVRRHTLEIRLLI